MSQGQMLEAEMMQQGVNAMDTGQFAENTPQPQALPEFVETPNGMPAVVPGAETEGGLPPAMGGMIPGTGLAGTPDESGMMR